MNLFQGAFNAIDLMCATEVLKTESEKVRSPLCGW